MDNTSKNFASNYQKQVLGFQSQSHLGGNEKFGCHLSPNNNCRSEFTVCLLRRQLEILCTTISTTTNGGPPSPASTPSPPPSSLSSSDMLSTTSMEYSLHLKSSKTQKISQLNTKKVQTVLIFKRKKNLQVEEKSTHT